MYLISFCFGKSSCNNLPWRKLLSIFLNTYYLILYFVFLLVEFTWNSIIRYRKLLLDRFQLLQGRMKLCCIFHSLILVAIKKVGCCFTYLSYCVKLSTIKQWNGARLFPNVIVESQKKMPIRNNWRFYTLA